MFENFIGQEFGLNELPEDCRSQNASLRTLLLIPDRSVRRQRLPSLHTANVEGEHTGKDGPAGARRRI